MGGARAARARGASAWSGVGAQTRPCHPTRPCQGSPPPASPRTTPRDPRPRLDPRLVIIKHYFGISIHLIESTHVCLIQLIPDIQQQFKHTKL